VVNIQSTVISLDLQSRVSLHAEHPEWSGAGQGSADQVGMKGAALERADIAAALLRLELSLSAVIRYDLNLQPRQIHAEMILPMHCQAEHILAVSPQEHVAVAGPTDSALSSKKNQQSKGQVEQGNISKQRVEDISHKARSSSRRAGSRSGSAEKECSRKKSVERDKLVESNEAMLGTCRATVEASSQLSTLNFVHHVESQAAQPRRTHEVRPELGGSTPGPHQQSVGAESQFQASKYRLAGRDNRQQHLCPENSDECNEPIKGRFLVNLPLHTLSDARICTFSTILFSRLVLGSVSLRIIASTP
jgi:hypothetical protein